MINALMPKEKDLIVAKWFPKDGAMEQGKIIKVKFYTDWRELREQPVQNLMSAREESEIENRVFLSICERRQIVFCGIVVAHNGNKQGI